MSAVLNRLEVDRVTDRPWRGRCATSGFTVADFHGQLAGLDSVPAWVTRAAVALCRAYASKGMTADTVARTIDAHRTYDGFQFASREQLAKFEAEARWTSPQYPAAYERWMLLCAVVLCAAWRIAGVSDTWYVCNTISGELHRTTTQGRAR